jgi:hypothetical protein
MRYAWAVGAGLHASTWFVEREGILHQLTADAILVAPYTNDVEAGVTVLEALRGQIILCGTADLALLAHVDRFERAPEALLRPRFDLDEYHCPAVEGYEIDLAGRTPVVALQDDIAPAPEVPFRPAFALRPEHLSIMSHLVISLGNSHGVYLI